MVTFMEWLIGDATKVYKKNKKQKRQFAGKDGSA